MRSPITQHPEIYPMKFTLVTVERISTGPETRNKNSFILYISLRLYSDSSARPVKFAAATMKCIYLGVSVREKKYLCSSV